MIFEKAVQALYDGSFQVDGESKYENITFLGKGEIPTKEQVEEKYKELMAEFIVEDLKREFIRIADKKHTEIECNIYGCDVTQKQIERCRDKYERAKAGEFDEEIREAIIKEFEDKRLFIRRFIDVIEDYRQIVFEMIDSGQIDKAKKKIEEFDKKVKTQGV